MRTLKDSMRMKKNSSSSIPHELRSSFALIEAYLNLIDDPLPAKRPMSPVVAHEYILRIKSNLRRLSRLINDQLAR